jgi:succinoglycan biosynthesis transport protein ExoP
MSSATQNKISSTASDLLPAILEYVKYLKLMIILILLGCFIGLIYFVFSPAVYESRSIVDLKIFALPIATDGLDPRRLNRSLLDQLNSRQMIASTAHSMGIGKLTDSFEELRRKNLRKISTTMLDYATLQISVFSENPHIVREFPKALVAHWESYQSEHKLAFMDVAVKKYKNELDQLRSKIDQKLKQEAGFVKENSIAQVLIEQNALAQVPIDLLRVQYRLKRYFEVRSMIKSRSPILPPLEELSLLSLVKQVGLERDPVGSIMATGDIKDRLTGPITGTSRAPQTVVVQPSTVTGLNSWQQIEKDLRLADLEYIEASRTFLDSHPKIIQVKDRIRNLSDGLNAELVIERQKFDIEQQQLEEELKQLQAKMPEYADSTEKLNRLKSDFQLTQDGDVAWAKAYTDLARNLTSMQFGADKDRVDLQFKGYSLLRDEDPVSPTKSKLIVIALALGFGLAVGIPFGLEQLDDRVRGIEATERATGLKGLGIIPHSPRTSIEKIDRLPETEKNKPDQILECYRVLRAQIMLEMTSQGHPGKGKVIMLTSARPSEGKSLTAGNLAWSFQSMGSKTLLVDLDFRRGRVHRFFQSDPGPGLCQLLIGDKQNLDFIRPTKLPMLDYISRGSTIAGSSELLCRLGIEKEVEKWREIYDWIILDSPPVLGLSETTTLQGFADTVVFVVRAEQTPTSDLKMALTQLKKSGAKLCGFVLNDLNMNKISNHYNYYYYTKYYYDNLERDSI